MRTNDINQHVGDLRVSKLIILLVRTPTRAWYCIANIPDCRSSNLIEAVSKAPLNVIPAPA